METTAYETTSSRTWSSTTDGIGEHECSHCRGYLGDDYCVDLYSDTGDVAVAVLRCMQCGKLLDPVILPRRFKEEAAAA